jgi:LAGLIDADG-like domain
VINLGIFIDNTVSNEVEAYTLGFLYADGFVTSNKKGRYYVVGSTVSLNDEQIILDISKFFKNSKVKYKSSNCQTGEFDTISLQICDVKLSERLINLGLEPQKTYSNNPYVFDNIPNNLKHHFIRGYFDGDGTVGIYNNKCCFGIVSCNENLLNSILNFIKNHIDTNANILCEKDKYYRLRIYGNPLCKKIESLLYKDATIFLKRKREVFERIQPLFKKKYKYKGIKYLSRNNKWQAEIYVNVNEQKRYLGLFETELEAVKAYNKEAKKLGKKEQDIIWESH